MGTRYTIKFSDTRKSRAFANVYGQHDGYLSGAGDGIKNALLTADDKVRKLVNGYSDPNNETNGMGCAAAMVVGYLKSMTNAKCGNVYLTSSATNQGEEFRYHLFGENDQLWLVAYNVLFNGRGAVIYDGPLSEFDGLGLEKGGDA